MLKTKRLILPALALFLVLSASLPTALAYFTDYEAAKGGATLHLEGRSEIEEKVYDNNKHIKVLNTGETNMVVRVRIVGDPAVMTIEDDGNWVQGTDEFWYYTKVLAPETETTEIRALVHGTEAEKLEHSFDIIVAEEGSRIVWEKKDGKNVVKNPEGWNLPVDIVREEAAQ